MRKKKPKFIEFHYLGEPLVLSTTLVEPITKTRIKLFEMVLQNQVGTKAIFKNKALEDQYRKDPLVITKYVFESRLDNKVTYTKFKRLPKRRRIDEGVDIYLSPVTPLEACVIIERTRKRWK